MSHSAPVRLARPLLAAALAAATAGCALSPGQYLGVVPTGQDDSEWGRLRPNQSLQSDTAPYNSDVTQRADLYSINPTTLAELAERRRVALQHEAAGGPGAPATTGTRRADFGPTAEGKAQAAVTANAPYQYLVGPQDILQVTVWNHPELSNPTATANQLSGRVVNADGTFFYPYVGKVKAQGRTVMAIRDELARRLAAYLVEPQVDVSVSGYRSQRAFVMGEVATPGQFPINDVPPSVADFIAQAGGLKETADLRAATINRGNREIPIDLYALYYQGDLSQNLRLQTGDVINIPENRYNKVFILGEVGQPQSMVLPRGRYSLAEAVSDAEGFNPLSSNAGHLYVIRAGEGLRPQIWHLNASSPDAMILADAFSLEPRDVVYVDPASVTRWARVINSILPSATFLERVSTR
ncbi:MAG: polysaccharide biosynthesis/export family protein [Pigmentiphaga sp.]|nr:polysaccharide biosynthesis/export family protein [Pigmentiphaga sp.]